MRVIWAIDVFREPFSTLKQSAQILEALIDRLALQIEPVFVFSSSELDITLIPGLASQSEKAHRESAERALRRCIAEQLRETPGLARALLPSKILLESRSRTRGQVEALESYARSVGAEAIVLSSHGHHGPTRLLIGSFVETLLHHSSIPTLAIGPGVKQTTPIKTILFATDFDTQSHHEFRESVMLAKQLGSKLDLYHGVPSLIEPLFQSGAYLFSGSWVPARHSLKAEVQKQYRRGNAWARWARNQGVDCEFILDESSGNMVGNLIRILRERDVGLITLVSRSGPVASTLLGSFTRQVLRRATCPTWILHPKANRQSRIDENPSALAS
jgi:nucleotide-binding universal stress UspA family protein